MNKSQRMLALIRDLQQRHPSPQWLVSDEPAIAAQIERAEQLTQWFAGARLAWRSE